MGKNRSSRLEDSSLTAEEDHRYVDMTAEFDGTADAKRAARHRHRGVEERLDIALSEIARLRRRVNDMQAQQQGHIHTHGGNPPLRNGVHIDASGSYWMARGGELHPMIISGAPFNPETSLGFAAPVGPLQRLREAGPPARKGQRKRRR